jgi:hypothetical protein
MVLFYDIDGDDADHDDWHSREHFHERLSIPGFLRATRWVSATDAPRNMVIYEVGGVDVATSPAYLERLNDPSPWTGAMMPRFRGMVRGFCRVTASAGLGLGAAAMALRLMPEPGSERRLSGWLADALPAIASRRGMVAAHLMQPAPPPPMTREQALRGPDRPMPWLVLATGYDPAALADAVAHRLDRSALRDNGAAADISRGTYTLHHTAAAEEVRQTPRPTASR